MPRLDLPGYLDEKLSWTSALGRDVSALMDAVSAIATHNETPFFPAYTDHGIDHLAAVLRWCVELTPPEAIAVLSEEDAAVIVGAALLHDIGMHLSEEGFAELVGGTGPWRPMEWFRDDHEGRAADRPWPDLWGEFRAEARHFDHTEIVRLLGSDHEGTPKVVFDDVVVPAALDTWDKLYVGEFIRRHHARLAHEIAVLGFPGLGDEWPLPPERPRGIADVRNLMGLVARSHNERLRMVVDHLDDHEDGDLAPAGVHVPFVAALLRIADYAQLGDDRAPTILLRMTAPQSPISIQAWKDHEAVTKVEPHDSKDPFALRFRVSPDIELSTYLQVDALLGGLQKELDQCAAVLAEVYGKVSTLSGLAKQRVRSNMDSPAFRDALPFVPRESRLRSAEDMFRLVIHDLYGDHPWVAGRELAQNALDAVRERWRVEAGRDVVPAPDPQWPNPDDPTIDVLVEILVGDDDRVTLRVADRGIGMTADTVIDYFLKAGASLGPTSREMADIPLKEASRFVKAGRFGIGALASFLLGDEVEVRTRHLDDPVGVRLTASLDSELIPVTRGVAMPIGTELRVRVKSAALARLASGRPIGLVDGSPSVDPNESFRGAARSLADWIRDSCATTNVGVHVITETGVAKVGGDSALRYDPHGDDAWVRVEVDGLGLISWSDHVEGGRLSVDGIQVLSPFGASGHAGFHWAQRAWNGVLKEPTIHVIDLRSRVPMSLNRFVVNLSAPEIDWALVASIGRELVCRYLLGTGMGLLHRPWGSSLSVTGGRVPCLPGIASLLRLDVTREVLLPEWDDSAADRVHRGVEPRVGVGLRASHITGAPNPQEPKRSVYRTQVDQLAAALKAKKDVTEALGMYPMTLEIGGGGGEPHPVVVGAARATGLTIVSEAGRRVPGGFVYSSEASQSLTLVSMAAASPGSRPTNALAETWMEVVGGPVPYDDAEREALAERIYQEHPEMRSHIDRQRRLAEEEARRTR